jgi:hypothetical protein
MMRDSKEKNRMQKGTIWMVASVMVSVFVIVSAYSQEDMVELDSSVFGNPERAAVPFRHDAHNEAAEIEECNECHHVYEDGELLEDESSEDQSCADCHDLESTGNEPSLRRAYHMNCKGCHQERKSGPIMCGECHPKG